MIVTDAVKRLTGCTQEEAELFAEMAASDIMRETNRSFVPDTLLTAQIEIAVIR